MIITSDSGTDNLKRLMVCFQCGKNQEINGYKITIPRILDKKRVQGNDL